ncbi:MAG: helix-hairpin-helix repeat-containing competence protein ComEA [Barrevirus sp.]|uniref:Helix-hairpin-helix repeat-containing competence protein ComEA n=1 Tax=Barrevirus sp. TaxID=2487763 RepID=A0A3G4ZQU9_9VIRU|nr:MAG: helix-hairpin-helix repeat-containing competence protein ComEA [Barrevirus sp.]
MSRLFKDDSFTILSNKENQKEEITSNIRHDLILSFITFLNNILPVLRIFMTIRQIEDHSLTLFKNFILDYRIRSSKGFIIIGKRITDSDDSYFFLERTHAYDPEERMSERKDRQMINSSVCQDTIFGELFSHALLKQIRVNRYSVENDQKVEVEWFKMNLLDWFTLTYLLNQISMFVQDIKSKRVITVINVNVATEANLKSLPLVGNKLSSRIVAERLKGPFTDINDLRRRVRKLGSRICNALREFVIFDNTGIINEIDPLININSASIEELKELPKIGKELAQRIVTYRLTNGPFLMKENLVSVKGIGPVTFKAVTDLITI